MLVERIESVDPSDAEETGEATSALVADRDDDVSWRGAAKDAKRAVLKVVVLSSGCVVNAAESVATVTRRTQSAAVAALKN